MVLTVVSVIGAGVLRFGDRERRLGFWKERRLGFEFDEKEARV